MIMNIPLFLSILYSYTGPGEVREGGEEGGLREGDEGDEEMAVEGARGGVAGIGNFVGRYVMYIKISAQV